MLAAIHAGFGHLPEVILHNDVAHRRYYGEEPAEIATQAIEEYWPTGLHGDPEAADELIARRLARRAARPLDAPRCTTSARPRRRPARRSRAGAGR